LLLGPVRAFACDQIEQRQRAEATRVAEKRTSGE
jgi:hypothetical protein